MKNLIEICNRIPLWCWLLLVGVLYYVQISQNLFVCDDFVYAQSVDGRPLSGLGDIISVQARHYLSTNGRFLVHCVVMLFAGILGMPSFRVFSTMAFVTLVYELYLICGRKHKSSISIFVLLLMSLLPSFNITFLGNIATITNYLWTSVLFCAFLICFERSINKTLSKSTIIWYSCLALISGALQESFSIGCATGALLFFLFNRKCISREAFFIVFCYCIGSGFVVLAPANFVREGHTNEGVAVWYKLISNAMRVLTQDYVFIVFGFSLLISWFHDRSKMRTFLLSNAHLLSVIVVSLLFAVCIAFVGSHQLTGAYLCLIILLFRWVHAFFPTVCERSRDIMSLFAFVVIMVLYPQIYHYRSEVQVAYKKMYHSAEQSVDGVFYSQAYDSLSYRNMNWIQEHFTSSELNQDFPLRTVSMYFSKGNNPEFLTTRLPYSKETIIRMCTSNNQVSDYTFHKTGTLVYIFCVPNQMDSSIWSAHIKQYNSTLGYIRNYLAHQPSPEIYEKIQPLQEFPSFKDKENTYFILTFKEEFSVVSAEVIRS